MDVGVAVEVGRQARKQVRLMCQGCEDFMEFDRAVDAYIAKELPKLMQQPLDVEVLFGTLGSED